MDLQLPRGVARLNGDVPLGVSDSLDDLARTSSARPIKPADSSEPVADIDVWNDGRWRVALSDDDEPRGFPSVGTTDAALLDGIVRKLNRLAIDLDPHRLHLHSAALEMDGTGILLCGRSGSGKSTVAFCLLAHGASYLSDECVTLAPGTRTCYAYPKPITLKRGSIEYLSNSSGLATILDVLPSANVERSHLRVSAIGQVAHHTRVGIVVNVRFEESVDVEIEPLDPAEACSILLADSLDGARFGPPSLESVAALAAGANCFRVSYSEALDAAEAIAQLVPPLRHHSLGLRYETRPSAEPLSLGGDAQHRPIRDPVSHVRAEFESSWIELSSNARDIAFGADRRQYRGHSQPIPEFTPVSSHASRDRSTPHTPVPDPASVGPKPLSEGDHVAEQTRAMDTERHLLTATRSLEKLGIAHVVFGAVVAANDSWCDPFTWHYDTASILASPHDLDEADLSTIRGQIHDPSVPHPERIELVRSLDVLSPNGSETISIVQEIVDMSTPVRIQGEWVTSMAPRHRLIYACALWSATEDRSRPQLLREIALVAPRTGAELTEATLTAQRWGTMAVLTMGLQALRALCPAAVPVELPGGDPSDPRALD